MRITIAMLMVLWMATPAWAHDRTRLTALEQRIEQLEKRVAELDASTAPAVAKASTEQRVDGQRKKARERMRKDAGAYSREQLSEIESLYQVANRKWRSQEGKESLERLIEKYDKANRTGCALLYLGQMSQGKEREEYLRKAIDGFSDCYYGDGVQVGAYARYYLAHYYKDTGKREEAEELFQELARDYPDAISHKGRLLEEMLDR